MSTSATENSPISLKGTSQGFEILIDSAAEAQVIAADIEAKLGEAPGFFKGGDVILRFDAAPPRGYLGPIEEVTGRFDLRIVGVHGPEKKQNRKGKNSDSDASRVAADKHGMDLGVPQVEAFADGSQPQSIEPSTEAKDKPKQKIQEPPKSKAAAVEKNAEESEPSSDGALAPKLVVGPVRSGSILEFAGHLIVIGDVNPGAEVRAAGSIIVLGRLRGVAHAACTGGTGFILALQMEPQQLRIASLVARAGDAEASPDKAEIAYTKNGKMIVDHYKGRVPFGITTAKF